MEASMGKLLADPVKSKAMKEALSKSKNTLADTLMYAEFADLSERDFKDICLFTEHDWMMFNECCEEEQQNKRVYILSEDAFYERVKSSSRLTYTLYKSMRKLQRVEEKFQCSSSCDCENKEDKWSRCDDCGIAVHCSFSTSSTNEGWNFDDDDDVGAWRCPPCYEKARINPIYVFEDMETWSGTIPSRIKLTDRQYNEICETRGEPRKKEWFDETKVEELANVSREQLAAIIKLVPANKKVMLDAILNK